MRVAGAAFAAPPPKQHVVEHLKLARTITDVSMIQDQGEDYAEGNPSVYKSVGRGT